MALAVAFELVACVLAAVTVTDFTGEPELPVVRASVAVVESLITPKESEAPIPALPVALALPVAVLVAVPVWLAVTDTLSAGALKLPVPFRAASVVRFATVTAATGTTATPPAAPPVALLVIALVEVAVMITSPLELIVPCAAGGVPVSPIHACVLSSMTLIATLAPMPTLLPVVVPLAG